MLVLSCLSQVSNYKVHVLATDPKTPVRQSRLYHSLRMAKPSNDDKYLEAIRKRAKQVGATLLMPVTRLGIHFAIRHQSALQQIAKLTPLPSLDAFEIAEDKGKLAEFLIEHQFPIPRSILCSLDPSFFHEAKQLRFPVLLKPNIGTHGNGIREFDSFAVLKQFLEENENSLKPCVVQSKLRGTDMAGNVLAKEGEILRHTFQRSIISNPVKFRYPSALKMGHHPEAFEVLKRLVSKLNWTGIMNVGLFWDEEDHQVKIIEINPRYWGSMRASLAAGMNFPHLACLMALGEPLPPNEYKMPK